MSGYRGVFFTIYRYLQGLFVVLLPVQFYLAAAGIFRSLPGKDNSVTQKKIEDNFGPHAGLGTLLTLISFLLLLIVLVARPGKKFVLGALALAVLLIIQNVLAWTGEDVPWVAALHGLNALIILGVSGFLASSVWHGHRKMARAEAPPA
ncbi:MAG TPA: DUF6220 domain-containing protein [Gaiellaceae bacterium]|nr:DUF6220 domain-containing protein [Gaiellaceae bacterium]